MQIQTYPLSLDDFNEPCAAVIVKKKNWHAKFLYATHLSVLTWLKWFKIFRNLFLSEYFLKKGFWELLSAWCPLFTFLWKKSSCALSYTIVADIFYQYGPGASKEFFVFVLLIPSIPLDKSRPQHPCSKRIFIINVMSKLRIPE